MCGLAKWKKNTLGVRSLKVVAYWILVNQIFIALGISKKICKLVTICLMFLIDIQHFASTQDVSKTNTIATPIKKEDVEKSNLQVSSNIRRNF